VLFGRGESFGAGAPFGMLAPAIRRLCGIVDGEPLDVSQRRLRARIGRHLRPADVSRIAALLGEMIGVPFPEEGNEQLRAGRRDPALMGDLILAAWEGWLAAELDGQPMMIVLEDLHWGDLPSVKFVDSALRQLAGRPFMVLALARPDIHQQFPELWAGRDVQEVRLGPLTRKAAEKLCRLALGEGGDRDPAQDAMIERIVSLADGNAFFLEELIRKIAAGEAGGDLPDTVLGMVQARLDALGDEAKRVLRAASVFGERFWRGGVAALLGPRFGGLRELLDDLGAREVITRRATATLPGETEYVFRHALVREAAYAMLTDEDRKLGHRLAGEWLERAAAVSTDTIVARADRHAPAPQGPVIEAVALAEHFALGGEPARAVTWYRRAAEQALEANDLAGAVARAERGVASGAQGEVLGALRLVQSEAWGWQGDHGRALDTAAQAVSLLLPGSVLWFRAASMEAYAASRIGEHARVRAVAREASAVQPEPGAQIEQVICLSSAALQLTFAGRFQYANELFQQIDELSGGTRHLPAAAAARIHVLSALRAYYAGDPAGNLQGLERALVAYQDAGDVRNVCQVQSWLGFAYVELGDHERADAILGDALSTTERMGLQAIAAGMRSVLGLANAYLGRLDRAAEATQTALAAYETLEIPRSHAMAHKYAAVVALLRGDAAGAEQQARLALEKTISAPPFRAGVLGELARALLARGRNEEALAVARDAMELLGSLGTLDQGETLIRLVYARALEATGNHGAARSAILAARDRLLARAQAIGDPRWRTSFLERVADNASTLELAERWGRTGKMLGA
jgi:tetratricopeptide (TPR) repeat protein